MVLHHVHHHVELNSTRDGDFLCVTHSHDFAHELPILDLAEDVRKATELSETFNPESCRSFDDVREVEVLYVIAQNNVGVDGDEKLLESGEHFVLFFVGFDLSSLDFLAFQKAKNNPDYVSGLVVHFHDASDLNDWVVLLVRESSFRGALNIK